MKENWNLTLSSKWSAFTKFYPNKLSDSHRNEKRNLKFSLKIFAPSKFVLTKKKQICFEKEFELKFRSKWTALTKFASDKQMRKEMKEKQLGSQIQLNMNQSSLIWFKQRWKIWNLVFSSKWFIFFRETSNQSKKWKRNCNHKFSPM